jgi:hypothetical protein
VPRNCLGGAIRGARRWEAGWEWGLDIGPAVGGLAGGAGPEIGWREEGLRDDWSDPPAPVHGVSMGGGARISSPSHGLGDSEIGAPGLRSACPELVCAVPSGPDPLRRLFDRQGRLFDRKGRLFDRKGRLFDRKGRLFDRKGRLFDRKGRLFDQRSERQDVVGPWATRCRRSPDEGAVV